MNDLGGATAIDGSPHVPQLPGVSGGPDLAASLALLQQLQPALQLQDRANIVDLVRQLVAIRAPMGAQWEQLANVAADYAEPGLARHAIDLYREAMGGGAAADYRKFELLARVGALAEAEALLDTLPDDLPEPAANAFSRGALAVYLGNVAVARDKLDMAIRLRPGLGQAWLSLGATLDYAQEPALLERLLAAGPVFEDGPTAELAVYCYALGKAWADLGEHERAFAAFERGAFLKQSPLGYDREQDAASAAQAVHGYTPAAIAALAGRQERRTARTLFVTGLPRSGTTLVEQILTSHSEVTEGGEINLLRLLAREVGGSAHGPLADHVARHGPEYGADLWHHWLAERFGTAGRVVDKSLETSRHLGLAAALLPEAPVVWLTRDPLDCAWSCFRTHFMAGAGWSLDLADIAFHMQLEDRLLGQWQDLLGDRLLVMPYEDLARDPAPSIARLLGHCGLSHEPQVFAPHQSRRAVTTSSVMQVRDPISARAVGAAAPYREFMGRFLDVYHA